jgi:hypothetical protein
VVNEGESGVRLWRWFRALRHPPGPRAPPPPVKEAWLVRLVGPGCIRYRECTQVHNIYTVYIYIPGCLPQIASFKVVELDFLRYLLVVVEPWPFMQDLTVFMQPWSTLHAWHDHLCSMRGLPNRLLASSSSPSTSHFIVASFTKFSLCPNQIM